MPLLTLDEARERLDPHSDSLLVSSFKTAVGEWNELLTEQPDLASAFSLTTRANIIHDLTCRAVRAALQGRENVRELKSLGFFALVVNDDLIVRFKYVPASLPNNVATEKQELLARQAFDEKMMAGLALEGIPRPATIATCGYKLTEDSRLGRATMQCDFNKATVWRYVIFGDSGEMGGSFEVLPLDPNLSPSSSVVVRSKSVTPAQEAQNGDAQS